MSRFRIIAFSGNLQRPSRTRTLVEAIGIELSRHINADLRVFDLLDAGPAFAGALDRAALPLPAAHIVDAIETADALIVGSPVHNGSYTGLFKHVFDLVEPEALAGKPRPVVRRTARSSSAATTSIPSDRWCNRSVRCGGSTGSSSACWSPE